MVIRDKIETMNDVVIRMATKEDLTQLVLIGQKYADESMYNDVEPYDDELAVEAIAEYLVGGHVIVAECNGQIGGMVMTFPCRSFWRRPELGLDVFYVAPEWRGTEMARKLIEAVVEVVKFHDYAWVIGASTSGFGTDVEKQFANTMKKHGFEELGRACMFKNPKGATS